MNHQFDLLLFPQGAASIPRGVSAGVSGIIIDWEHIAKERRQAGFDTQINHDTLDDLVNARRVTSARLVCRINAVGDYTPREVLQAIDAGADEILVPMVRTPAEVEQVLRDAAGGCRVGILVETRDAVRNIAGFADLPLSRVYVGLNDLAIDRGSGNIFVALVDGTVEQVRRHIRVPFGFGGLTLPDRGHPVPCRLLIGEMARMNCHFSFLRRSFHRDMAGRDPGDEIRRLRLAIQAARCRTADEIDEERQEFEQVVASLSSVVR